MNTFEKPASASESVSPEKLRAKLFELYTLKEELLNLAVTSGENIDAELGSEAYIDHGYTAQLREEVEPEIKKLEQQLSDLKEFSQNMDPERFEQSGWDTFKKNKK